MAELRRRKPLQGSDSALTDQDPSDDTKAAQRNLSHQAPESRSFGWGKICCGLGLGSFVLLAACVLYLVVAIKTGSRTAISTTHNGTNFPAAHYSRYRVEEYRATGKDRFFFQWWNYLVFDPDTDDHFNIIYQVTDYAPSSQRADTASVSIMHLRGPQSVASANVDIPLDQLKVTGDFSLEYQIDGKTPFRQIIVDDDTYKLTADFSPEATSDGNPMKWELTFKRIHGMYGGQDQEEDNKGDLCFIVSTLFAHNSRVSGWIESGGKRFEISSSEGVIKQDGEKAVEEATDSRFRAYAAGSWGCQLPNGVPALEYPWTWFWISIPADQIPAQMGAAGKDIGIVMGTARFQSNVPLINDIYGGFSSVGIGSDMWTSRFATVNHGGAIEVPLLGSASDGQLSNFTVTNDEWVEYSDTYGSARIPLRQTFHVVSEELEATIDFFSTIDQYFRAPVRLEKDLQLRVFSDFRAVGVRTLVRLVHRSSGTVMFDGEIHSNNALEYAYEPQVDFDKLREHGLLA